MTRRAFLETPALAAAVRRPPNVVILITDDQGYGDLSIHGNPHLSTPNIDSIARAGVQFTQFHVSPVCSPTRASVMTGRYNYRTGVVDTYIGRSLMRPSEVTLAESFRAAGYRTGIFGKWHLGDNYPMRPIDKGFETAITLRGGGLAQPSGPPGNGYFDPELERNGVPERFRGYCTDIYYSEAAAWIERHRRDPFFAYVATNAPHEPYQVDDSLAAPFRAKGLADNTAKIYGMVKNIDDNVGRLLSRLRALDLERDTVVVFLTDNGPQAARYNAGMRGIKGAVYEGGIRVPCFLRYPRAVKAGERVDRLAAHIDLFPTLHEACGIPAPAGVRIDGRSLWPLATGRQPRWTDRSLGFQWHRGDVPVHGRDCAVRDQHYKLVNRKELYDLESDPGESKDVSSEKPDVVARLRSAYDEWFQDVTAAGFEPARIHLGSPKEPVSILTRQDRRGAEEGWGPYSDGWWEVEVERAGRYRIRLRFPATSSGGAVEFRLGSTSAAADFGPQSSEVVLERIDLPAGPARVEAHVRAGGRVYGAHYVHVETR